MDQELRLFNELRLHPWVPENKVKIDAWIARLSVEDPTAAQNKKREYAEKMQAYLDAQPKEVISPVVESPAETVVTPTVPSEPVTETVVATLPINKSKKKSIHSPQA